MTYAEPLLNQVLMFIRSVGPGVIIGILYDVIFTFFRTISVKRYVIIAADLTFSIIATLISFFYMVIYNSGTVRLNIIVAEAIGAVAIHITMGKYVAKFVGFIGKTLGKIVGIVFYPVNYLSGKIRQLLIKIPKIRPIREKRHIKDKFSSKKIMNIIKIHLKKQKKYVY